MKHWNKNKIKRFACRILALVFCLAMLLPLVTHDAAAFDAAEVVSKIQRGKLYLFKWTPLLNGDNARSGANYVTMLNQKNKTIRGTDRMRSGPDEAQIYVDGNYTPFNYGTRTSDDVFYTLGSMGAPIIYRVRDDGDNNGYEHTYWLADKDYPFAPRQAINRDGDGDWDEFSQKYGKDLTGDAGYANWIDLFLDGKEPSLGQYNSSVSYFTLSGKDGKFTIFKNISMKRDPAWQCYDNGRIWCDQESDDSDRCHFNIWYGDPTVYSTLTQSYAIGSGQTLTLDSESESYRGIYIPPTVTLTVQKNATLAINENVFNDGTIYCDGGTVIIQSNGALSPMSNDGTGEYVTDGKNKIIIQNGGVLIVMPGGKLYTTPKYPMTLINARMINFGSYVMGGDLELYSSMVENRQGGQILCGWNFSRADRRPEFENTAITTDECSNMTQSYGSYIKVFDTKEHFLNYGCLIGTATGATIDPEYFSDDDMRSTIAGVIEGYKTLLNIVTQ